MSTRKLSCRCSCKIHIVPPRLLHGKRLQVGLLEQPPIDRHSRLGLVDTCPVSYAATFSASMELDHLVTPEIEVASIGLGHNLDLVGLIVAPLDGVSATN